MKINKIITKRSQVILASSSLTRIKMIKKTFNNVKITEHKINEVEEKEKKKNLDGKKLAKHLAKIKAKSVTSETKNSYIIGCDQILECNKKTISKPSSLKEAKKNLLFLTGKNHELHTCIYVLKDTKEFFVEQTTSKLYFKKISEAEIDKYIKENKKTVLSCVGSYKIENNKKYKYLEIIKGDKESIVGFPIKNFLDKIKKQNL